MTTRFVISDTHFGHTNSWEKFKLADGVTPLRPFTSTEEMDEAMIERWNAKVGPNDVVYHLGDVVINRKYLHLVKRLNGKKRLVRGNHDIFKDVDYTNVGFEALYGTRVFTDKFIMSHIPLHPDCVTTRFRVNVHGHLHANEVMQMYDTGEYHGGYPVLERRPDPRYMCVSVEHTNFEPLSFEEVEERIAKRWVEANYTPPAGAGWGNGSSPS